MMRCKRIASLLLVVFAAFSAVRVAAQQHDYLTDEEVDTLRQAQEPSQRIEVYLDLEQTRLARMKDLQEHPAELNSLLSQCVSISQEMKDWIQDQYDRKADMRRGLRALLDRGPKQLDALREIRKWPGSASAAYADNLTDAIDSLTDAMDGSTQALSDQQKTLGELKREQKAETHATKQKLKEEKKRNEEEKKLQKRMRNKSESDSNEN